VLALLATAIDPAQTRGHVFAVVFAIEEPQPLVAHLLIADGAAVSARAGRPETPGATVHVPRPRLCAFLSGEAPAAVSGDVAAVHALCGWIDAAQGLGRSR